MFVSASKSRLESIVFPFDIGTGFISNVTIPLTALAAEALSDDRNVKDTLVSAVSGALGNNTDDNGIILAIDCYRPNHEKHRYFMAMRTSGNPKDWVDSIEFSRDDLSSLQPEDYDILLENSIPLYIANGALTAYYNKPRSYTPTWSSSVTEMQISDMVQDKISAMQKGDAPNYYLKPMAGLNNFERVAVTERQVKDIVRNIERPIRDGDKDKALSDLLRSIMVDPIVPMGVKQTTSFSKEAMDEVASAFKNRLDFINKNLVEDFFPIIPDTSGVAKLLLASRLYALEGIDAVNEKMGVAPQTIEEAGPLITLLSKTVFPFNGDEYDNLRNFLVRNIWSDIPRDVQNHICQQIPADTNIWMPGHKNPIEMNLAVDGTRSTNNKSLFMIEGIISLCNDVSSIPANRQVNGIGQHTMAYAAAAQVSSEKPGYDVTPELMEKVREKYHEVIASIQEAKETERVSKPNNDISP